MADDTTIYQGTGGDRVASDELASLNGVATVADSNGKLPKAQRVKLLFGDDGDGRDASAAHPLPVTDPSVVAAIQTLQGYVDALEGNTAGLATQTTLAAVLSALQGALTVGLPTGAATSANQATQNTKLDTLHTDLGAVATQATLASVLSQLQGTLVTAPNSAGDVAGTLTDGRKTSSSPGTAVAVRASLACKWVCVTALKTNTDQVNVGGSGVVAAAGSSTGQPLAAGESVTLPVNDAAKVFVDVRVSGEGVSFTVGS